VVGEVKEAADPNKPIAMISEDFKVIEVVKFLHD
jgi:hypothetical protein